MSDKKLGIKERRALKRQEALRVKEEGAWYPKWFWPSFAVPATIWMIAFFALGFYVVLSVAMGTVDPYFRNAVPVYQPWWWNVAPFGETFVKIFGSSQRSVVGIIAILLLSLAFYSAVLLWRERVHFWVADSEPEAKRPRSVTVAMIVLTLLGLIGLVAGFAGFSRSTGIVRVASIGWVVLGVACLVSVGGVFRRNKSGRSFGVTIASMVGIDLIVTVFFLLSSSSDAVYGPAFVRTFTYVFLASVLCIGIGYPVAYFVARHSGSRKGLYLVLLVSPFWISYLMRMLAWVNILQPDGYMNRMLITFGLMSAGHPYGWLEGHGLTVTLGLVYGYIPYMILPLFAGLDRIPGSLLEASRDLGAGSLRTFLRVTLPMSKQAILAGCVIVTLPMFGDYYTNNLLSRRPTTQMIGNLIDNNVNTPGQGPKAAVLVLVLSVILLVPMVYYMRQTAKETGAT